MLEGLKRLFGGTASAGREWEGLGPWAQARQCSLRTVKELNGFIVEGRLGTLPWRLEWGPSQRAYIEGSELRLRAEMALPSDLQVVVLSRRLQEQMEKDVFEQYVEGVQTRIDTETPAEMRWVVMYPKMGRGELGELRDRYAAVSSFKPWLQQWLAGPLTSALAGLKIDAATAFVLMIGRGRLTLRTEVEDATPGTVEPHLRVFEIALREAQRVAANPPTAKPAGA